MEKERRMKENRETKTYRDFKRNEMLENVNKKDIKLTGKEDTRERERRERERAKADRLEREKEREVRKRKRESE